MNGLFITGGANWFSNQPTPVSNGMGITKAKRVCREFMCTGSITGFRVSR